MQDALWNRSEMCYCNNIVFEY